MAKTSASSLITNTGHKLTPKEAKFIDLYLEIGNGQQSVIQAGFNSKAPHTYANSLLNKNYIAEEIKFRMDKISAEKIASAQEIMEYFSAVMRGELKDQFGLEAPLGERTKAAQELAKRQIDIPNKLANNQQQVPEIKITLDWARKETNLEDEPNE